MNRRFVVAGLLLSTVTACSGTVRGSSSGGTGARTAYKITDANADGILFRTLDGVNALRSSAGLAPVALDAKLNASAATHSRDMALQNRPWHFGSDGSSPVDRARRVGFNGRILGETISESYETETETLSAWMRKSDTRAVIMDPNARLMGISWYQEPTGKIWWTMIMGA